jgi:aryl-alcohol dehydrogenase-like predicted oxidoreductase
MERRALANGVEVSRIILGCGNFGGIGSAPEFFGRGESQPEAERLLDAAWRCGIRCLDTADAYGGGRSEAWIGEWLRVRGVRDELVLGTKVFHSVEGDPGDRGLAPERIRRQLDGSLARLGVDRVDLYLIHEPDPNTPLAATLEALDGLVREGKVGAIGASNVDGEYLEEALRISDERGFARFEWVQNSYSLLDREAERDVLPLCREHGLGFTPFGPLAGGWLTGKYRRGQPTPVGSRMAQRPEPYVQYDDERVYAGIDALARRAAERDVDIATLALAWLLSNPDVTAVVLGPRRPEHLRPGLAALELELSPDERRELVELFAQP